MNAIHLSLPSTGSVQRTVVPTGLPMTSESGVIVIATGSYRGTAAVRVPGSFSPDDPIRRQLPICEIDQIAERWMIRSLHDRCTVHREGTPVDITDRWQPLSTGDVIYCNQFAICVVELPRPAASSTDGPSNATANPVFALARRFADACQSSGLAAPERLTLLRAALPRDLAATLPTSPIPDDQLIWYFTTLWHRTVEVDGMPRRALEILIETASGLVGEEHRSGLRALLQET